jgi:MFS transporter, DHA1 family, multidrug resistance protein
VPAAFVAAAVPVLVAVVVDLVRPASDYWGALAPRSGAEPSGEPEPPDEPAPAPRRSATLVTLAIVSFGLFFARFAGEQGLIPVLAYDRGGLEPLTLGIAFALGTVVSAAALGVVGRWVDAGARVAVVVVSVVGVVVATLAFGVLPSPAAFGLAIVVYAVATSLANVVPSVVTAEAFPGRSSGAAVGVTRTAGDIGAAVGPLAVFGLVELAGVGAGLAMLAAVPALAMVLLLVRVRRDGGANQAWQRG